MKLSLVCISSRTPTRTGAVGDMLRLYAERIAPYAPFEVLHFASEAKWAGFVEAAAGRTRPVVLLADSRGDQITSEALAEELGARFDAGVQRLVVGIGPADGWSAAALQRADRRIAFGRITLPHELAAVVAAEQIYRALTIRAGHPYHSGH